MPAQVIPLVREEISKETERDWREPFFMSVGDQMEAMTTRDSMDTLHDITSALWSNRSETLGQLALTLIRKRFGELFVQEQCNCPHCAKLLRTRGLHKRQIVTLSGSFELERPYFYCVASSYGFYPLDGALKLNKSPLQYDVQDLGACLATELPYEVASDAVERATGISFSAASLHDCVKRISADLEVPDVCPSKEEMLAKIGKFSEGKRCRSAFMITID